MSLLFDFLLAHWLIVLLVFVVVGLVIASMNGAD